MVAAPAVERREVVSLERQVPSPRLIPLGSVPSAALVGDAERDRSLVATSVKSSVNVKSYL